MSVTELTTDTFHAGVTGEGITLVDRWASWCGPCRQFAPVYATASERHPDTRFTTVDTEAEPELAGAAGIRSIPTLMAIRDGIMVLAQPGVLPPAALEQVIAAVRRLDMADARQRGLVPDPIGAGRGRS